MGYIILLLVVAGLWMAQRIASAAANAAVNMALGLKKSTKPAEPDWLCMYCPQRWHDGGKRCTKCSGFTSSSAYQICHECAGKSAPVLPSCESCGRPY